MHQKSRAGRVGRRGEVRERVESDAKVASRLPAGAPALQLGYGTEARAAIKGNDKSDYDHKSNRCARAESFEC